MYSHSSEQGAPNSSLFKRYSSSDGGVQSCTWTLGGDPLAEETLDVTSDSFSSSQSQSLLQVSEQGISSIDDSIFFFGFRSGIRSSGIVLKKQQCSI